VIVVYLVLIGRACVARPVATEQHGWGTIYNDTNQNITIHVICGTSGPRRTFTLLPQEELSLRVYSQYEVVFPGSRNSYVVDAVPPSIPEGSAEELTKWQIRYYHIAWDEDGTLAVYRGVPRSRVKQFERRFRSTLTSSGIAGKLGPSDPVIWKIIQEQLIDQSFHECLDDCIGSHFPLRFELISDENEKAEQYILAMKSRGVPLSREIESFVARCIEQAYNVKVKRVIHPPSIEQFILLASQLPPEFCDQGKRILTQNILKLVQEQLQEWKLHAAINTEENGFKANTDWLRATEVPKALQGADIRWSISVKVARIYSEEYKQDYLDYNCDVEVRSKPRSASPNKYRRITVPAGLTYRLEMHGVKGNTALETIPGDFEHRVYEILTKGRKEKRDTKKQ
jgi:hypothetical protein